MIAALLLFGRMSDTVGRRPVLLLGLLLGDQRRRLSAGRGLPAALGRLLSGFSAGIFTGTATATLVDLAGPEGRGRATLVAAIANMGGLGCGPLLAGLLAQLAPWPLRLSFWADLALLLPAVAGIS